MFIKLQNSCSYHIFNEYFEISSDVFNLKFKFKGFTSDFSKKLLQQLQEGIREDLLWDCFYNEHESNRKNFKTLISFLKEKKLLITCSDISNLPPEDTLYDRQIRFLSSFETNEHTGKEFNKKLQNRKVVIVGLGAYGSWLLLHCARLGIKHIVGIDHDVVELSNLHRQVLYTKEDIGLKKAEACAKIVTGADASVKYEGICKKIESEEDLLPYLSGADFIFNAFGYYPIEEAQDAISGFITKASIKATIPMLCLSTNWIGPLYLPGSSACYFCAVTNSKLDVILRKVKKNPRIDKRAFCPILAMTCSLAVLEAVRYLTGINMPSAVEGIRYINPFYIEKSTFFPIEKNINCQFCKGDNEHINA